jgi:hypothetical protein
MAEIRYCLSKGTVSLASIWPVLQHHFTILKVPETTSTFNATHLIIAASMALLAFGLLNDSLDGYNDPTIVSEKVEKPYQV